MEKAKAAVSKIISKDGKHDTVVDEDVRNPVTEQHVHPQQHEEVTTAVDREVHQHHHQTAVQPIQQQETLPTQHTSRAMPVQERKVDKGNDENLKAALAKDQAKYRDTETVHDTKTSTSAAAVEGVHTHHHVHQHVQPVIQKDVIQPEVVHTTVPVHEVHHEAPVHHETTMLPAMTMDEFRSSNKGVDASTPRVLNKFDGCPTAKDEKLRGDAATKQHIHGN